MITVSDDLGNVITLKDYPLRIASTVPSITELLHHLDLENEIVGITNFCTHPKHFRKTKTRIGGTKTIDISLVKELSPDLIIANKEENIKEQIDELGAIFPVFVTDIIHLLDAQRMISNIGILTNRTILSNRINHDISRAFSSASNGEERSYAYLIWKNPYMAAGPNTFIHHILKYCGWNNVLRQSNNRYPEIRLDELKSLSPEVVFLSSEPYPFRDKNKKELEKELLDSKIILIDGRLISWYGPSLTEVPAYLNRIKRQLQ